MHEAVLAKIRTPEQAAALVGDGDDLLLPLAPAQPRAFLRALGRRERFDGLHVWCALLQEPYDLLRRPGVTVASQFFGPVERFLRGEGVPIEFAPADFHGLEILAQRLRPRVVASTVSLPDDDGWMSFGLHAGASEVAFAEAARDPSRLVIVEANRFMPRSRGIEELGGHRIHASHVDALVLHDEELPVLPDSEPTDADRRIAALVEELVPEGATLQFGIGAVPNEIAALLAAGPRGDFGIHTEMLVDGIRRLCLAGKVSNQKGSYDGLTICTFAFGSRELYDWTETEPTVRFLPVSAVNMASRIAQNRRFVSINAALMIDLHGQVVADTIAGRQYSGIGGHESFVSGAREAPDGVSVVCLHSTALVGGERRTKIVAELPLGSIVTTPRHQVHWVATEHGMVDLFGLTDRQRREALTELAAPEFHADLRQAAAGRSVG